MPKTFIVAPGRAMVVRGPQGVRKILRERTVVTPDHFKTQAEFEKHVKNGFIMRFGGEDEAEIEPMVKVTHDGVVEKAPPPPPRAVGLWNVDPKKLRGKKLDALNVMIAEKDEAHPLAESVEDAIAILSADFQG